MANKDSYYQYMVDKFTAEVESILEFQIALKEGEIDQDQYAELVQDVEL